MPEIAALEGSDIQETNLFSYCNNNPINKSDATGMLSNWGKVAVGVGVIAAAAILTAATGGAGAGVLVAAVHCVAAGALEGAVIGAVTGAVTGAVEGAIASRITNGNWSGAVDAAWDGMANGFMWGSITGAITGALSSPYCFVAGTSVLTAAGAVAIEKIRAGDYVWAWDEETGQTALKEVLETYVNETDELVHIHVNGEEIITTPGHPFYAPHKGWTEAADLRAGDILVLVNGEYVVVEKIQHELLEAPIPVYNFNVDGFHTYFVTGIGVLVHNRCGGETSATKYGRQMHKNWDYGPNVIKEYNIPGVGRADGVDLVNRIVYELKPNNSRAIKQGWKQLARYANGLAQSKGGTWTKVLLTYDRL